MTVGIGLNVLALVVLVVYVLRRAIPLTEAARLRNALLLEQSQPADFDWTPPHYPPGFKVERMPATEAFRAVIRELGVDRDGDDWDRSLVLARHLTEHAAEKGALQADLTSTYQGIRAGYGYCADFVKVYLALAHAAGIPVRQWAFSFDGFGGHGHTVVEVFDRQRRRWMMIDVHGNVHFVDPDTAEPLDARDVRALLAVADSRMKLVANGPGRAVFRYPEKALDYYRRGLDGWYLWWGNSVFSYYGHPAVAAASRLSRWLAHLVANILRLQPRIHILRTTQNEGATAAMFALRRVLWSVVLAILVLLVSLAWQLSAMRAHGS